MTGRQMRTVSCENKSLLSRVGAGGGALRGRNGVFGADGWVSACALEALESNSVSELCNSNDRRVVLVHEFPET